jgi:hypothetical protein
VKVSNRGLRYSSFAEIPIHAPGLDARRRLTDLRGEGYDCVAIHVDAKGSVSAASGCAISLSF